MRSGLVASAFFAGVILAAGCIDLEDAIPRVGDSCEAGGRCQDDRTVLSCEANSLRAFPCRGPKGCMISGSTVLCDPTGNLPGDACTAANEQKGFCSPTDPESALICVGGLFEERQCRGGCHVSGQQFFCAPAS